MDADPLSAGRAGRETAPVGGWAAKCTGCRPHDGQTSGAGTFPGANGRRGGCLTFRRSGLRRSPGPGSATTVSFALAGQIRITEYIYTGPGGEFVEFTSVSDAPVDMTGWRYDNSARA